MHSRELLKGTRQINVLKVLKRHGRSAKGSIFNESKALWISGYQSVALFSDIQRYCPLHNR